MSSEIRASKIAEDRLVPDISPLTFKTRKALVRILPQSIQNWLARAKARSYAARERASPRSLRAPQNGAQNSEDNGPVFRPLALEDCDAVARLHVEALPTSILSHLGTKAVTAFYRFCLRDSREEVFVAAEDGHVVAAAMITDTPETLNLRFVLQRPGIWPELIRKLVESEFRRSAMTTATIIWDDASESTSRMAPELLYIFCADSHRSRGVGGRLLGELIPRVGDRGSQSLFVRTFDDDGHPALRFYLRHGFRPVAHIDTGHMIYRLLNHPFTPDCEAATENHDPQ